MFLQCLEQQLLEYKANDQKLCMHSRIKDISKITFWVWSKTQSEPQDKLCSALAEACHLRLFSGIF